MTEKQEKPSFLADEEPIAKPYKNIDITPKSLMHLTSADFVEPTKEEAAS